MRCRSILQDSADLIVTQELAIAQRQQQRLADRWACVNLC
jgi:hypothetical protein